MATIPGPTAYAAMSALKDQIPLYIKDEDEAKKAINEVSKSQADILEAEQRARSGQWEAAAKQRQDAVMKPLDLYMKFLETNKPSGELQLYQAATKNPELKKTLMDIKGEGPEAREYAAKMQAWKASPEFQSGVSFKDWLASNVEGNNSTAGNKLVMGADGKMKFGF